MTATEAQTNLTPAGAPLLERILFVVLVCLTAMRPLVTEVFQQSEISILQSLQAAVGGPTPAITAALDSATAAMALYILLRRPRRGLGWTLYYFAAGGLAVAVVLSTAAADEQRIALNAGVSLLASVLSIGALTRLCSTTKRQRLLLAAVLASGVATAAQCLLEYTVYNPLMAEDWPRERARLLESGLDPNSPQIVNFERRLMASEASGFQAHPNVTASMLAMWALPLLSLTLACVASRQMGSVLAVFASIASLACGFSVYTTGSIAGLGAGLGGLLLLIGLGGARKWFGRRSGLLAAGLLAGYLGIIFAGAGYGLVKGTLPHPSLEVRWFYWSAAAQAVPDAPLTGIGRENFRDAYTQYRPPTSTEEVSNPHDLWVTALVELGPLGLLSSAILFVLIVAGLSRQLAQLVDIQGNADIQGGSGVSPAADESDSPPLNVGPKSTSVQYKRATPAAGKMVEFPNLSEIGFTAIGVLTLWLVLSDTALHGQSPADQFATFVLWLFENAGVWLISFVVLLMTLRDSRWEQCRAWLAIGILAAVMTGFVHNLVGFSFFLPSGLAVLGGLIAVGLNLGRANEAETETEQQQHRRTFLAALSLIVVGGGLTWLVAKPTADADSGLRQMRGQLSLVRSETEAATAFEIGWQAVRADSLDARTPRTIAREILQFTGPQVGQLPGGLWWLEQAQAFSQASLDRNPRSNATLKQYAIIHEYLEMAYLLQLKPDEASEALKTSADFWTAAIERYPTDLRGLVDAGVMLTKLWRETEDATYAQQAREYFQRAREINDGYRDDEPVRLQPAEIRRLKQSEAELPNEPGRPQ
jgi:hypothetical protein